MAICKTGYTSWTPEGDEWTRYQAENYRELDTTRLITYAGHKPSSFPEHLSVPHDSFRHLDFICINLYNTLPEFETSIKNIHRKYPDKPVFITEFGLRLDRVKNEQERIDHLKGVIDIARRNPYVCGMAYWSFNDYRSRYPDTDPNGYREWGIVDANRKPRGLYTAFQKDLSPVTVAYDNSSIKISARADFPSYTLKNYKLVLVSDHKIVEEYPLPELNPGESTTIKTAKPSASTTIAIQNAGGFRVYDSSVN